MIRTAECPICEWIVRPNRVRYAADLEAEKGPFARQLDANN